MIAISLIHTLPILFIIILLAYAVLKQRKELQDIYKRIDSLKDELYNIKINYAEKVYVDHCTQRYSRNTSTS